MDISTILQMSSVLMGTLLGGPLIASSEAQQRLKGFSFVALGSACSLIAQLGAGLYILALSNLLWICISLKGVYLNLEEDRRPRWVREALCRLNRRVEPLRLRRAL